MVDEGLLDLPVLNLSGYLRKHQITADALLLEVTRQQCWQDWVLFFIKACEESAAQALWQIRAMRQLARETDQLLRREVPKMHSVELLDTLFARPYCRIQDLVENDIAKRQTASIYLKKLCELNVLEQKQHGKEKLFLNKKLLAALNLSDSR